MTVTHPGFGDVATPSRLGLSLGFLVATLSLSVLAGWALDIAPLRNALPFGIEMRANAALGLLLCGTALALLSLRSFASNTRLPRMGAAVAGTAVALLGALTLAQDLAGWSLGIDQWLFVDATGTARSAIPGRMTPPASFSLSLLGIALVVASMPAGMRGRQPIVSALASTVVIVGAIALVGHLAEAMADFRFLSYVRIAAYAALGLVLVGCGLLALMGSERGRTWSLDFTATVGFAIGVVALIVAAGISYQFTSRLGEEANRVNRTLETLKEIQELSGNFRDFTISAGRYIITRDERALEGREAIKAAIQSSLYRLGSLTADRPETTVRLGHIARLHAQRITLSDEIISTFRERSAQASTAGETSPLGKIYPALGFEIEALIKAVEAGEYDLLAAQHRQSEEISTRTFLLLPLSTFLGVTMLVLGLFFMNEGAGARALAELQVARKRVRLELLHDIDRSINAGKSPEQIVAVVLPRLRGLLDLQHVVVNLGSMDLMGDIDGLKGGKVQLIDAGAVDPDVRWVLVVPMIVGGKLIGGLSIGGPSQVFSSDQLEIATGVAAQLAIAITQSQLAERATLADAQYRLVFENVPVGIAMTRLEGTILSANPAFARMLGYASAAQALSALGRNARSVYANLEDREAYLRILQGDKIVERFETRFLHRDGSHLWVSISGRPVHDLKGEDSLMVTIIDDITLRKEQENRIARLNRVRAMQSSINSAMVRIRERGTLLDEVCRVAVVEGRFRAAWVAWHDAAAHRLLPIAHAGNLEGYLDRIDHPTDVAVGAETGISVEVLRSGVSVFTNDIRTSPAVRYRREALERGFLSAMHLPLRIGGAVEGVLVFFADEAGFFDEEERRLLEDLAADVSFALESLQKSELLDYLAFCDPLTGLPNRRLFHDRLSHDLHSAAGSEDLIAVVLVDLERFRRVNETLGRSSGDALLRDVGKRLQHANDTAARIGIDMFALVIRGARNVAEVNRDLGAVVQACFAESFRIGTEELRLAGRAGVAIYPDDGPDADTLLHNAEAALRRSKGTDDRVMFYTPDMNARVAEALAIETKLRRAVERHEFVLHYQPKIALTSGRITGVEALIRWQDPEKGLVPPGKFIPALEETGMIIEVGRWAVEQAFADMRAWVARGIPAPRVAVNVSAVQLQHRDFVAVMIGEIARGGDSPELLELEITESLVMRDVRESIRKLSILRGMGVTIAIDDFGTGYSSLSYLSRLPVDSLKIDRAFVSGLASGGEAETIVSTVIALAHGLKLKAVAEGVETREQAEKLHELGCDEAQGYLYSRPVPAGEMEALLRASPL